MADFVDIGPECFTDTTKRTISYQGANYYKACDQFVSDLALGGQTFCVKRVGHPGSIHEDFDGRIKDDNPPPPHFVRSDDPEVKGVVEMKLSALSLEEAVYQSVGAASVCWENMSGAGVFRDDRARDIAEQLLHRIREAGPIYG